MELFKNLGIDLNSEASTEKEIIVQEVLNATGLNWEVKKMPTHYTGFDGQLYTHENDFTNVRSDNNAAIKIVGKDYTILQNAEAVEMTLEAGKELFDIDAKVIHPWNNTGKDGSLGSFGNMAGGSLKGGAAIFVQLELPEVYIGRSNVERFITVCNTHDGSRSLSYGNGNQVVCCENTFLQAIKELSKIRHTASMTERIEEAKGALKRILSFEDIQMKNFDKAAKIDFKKSHLQQLMGELFGAENVNNAMINPDKVTTRTKNQIEDFSKDVLTSVDEQGSTLWALFNGVTRYTNHTRTAKDKDFSLMFGGDAKINDKAYKLLETWI